VRHFPIILEDWIAEGAAEDYMGTEQQWQELYRAAVLETNWSRMTERIHAAESAITERLREFSARHGGTAEENQAIVDALNRLNTLRSDLASWRK
jgi:hypothetical protein